MNEASTPRDAAGGTDPSDRRQYKSGERRREEIVDATLAILAEEGMHAWTTAALADRVGVSEATLFKHFDSKDDILSAALRHQARELRARVEAYRAEGPPWERAAGLVREVLTYMEEAGGGPIVILLGHAARIRPDMREEVVRTAGLFRRRIVAYLSEVPPEAAGGAGAGGGAGTADRVEALADLVVATVQSVCLRWSVQGQEGRLGDLAAPMLAYLGETAAAGGAGS